MPNESFIGKIHSIFCKDFLTFDECTFYPKPQLNVIIGPNGSGKSSVISAIALGLGGEPRVLNRSNKIGEFVRAGCTEAKVAIEIFECKEETKRFCRIFDTHNASRYEINGVATTKSNFINEVAKFQIQINNLCQFLPQDRVQDFLKMDTHELLLNTLAAVDNENMVTTYQNLIGIQDKLGSREEFDETESLRQEQKKSCLNNLEIEVNQFREREALKEKINWYKHRIAIREIDQINETILKIKTDGEKLQANVKVLNSKYHRLQAQMKSTASTEFRLKNNSAALLEKKAEMNAAMAELRKQLTGLHNKLKQSEHSIYRGEIVFEKQLKLIENEEQYLKVKLFDYNQLRPQEGDCSQEYDNEIQLINSKVKKNRTNILGIKNKLDSCIVQINVLQSKLERLNNCRIRKMELLESNYPHLYTAVVWLEQNRSMFKENIYNPMMMELNVPDEKNCKYVENTIKMRDLCAFTCESKEDMSLFINELCSKQKLNISVIHSPKTDVCHFTPGIPISNLKQFGFNSYMIDLVQGPAPIINKLCSAYKIHEIPVGDENVDSCKSQIPDGIRLYFGGDKRYAVTASRYRSTVDLIEIRIQQRNVLYTSKSKEVPILQERLRPLLEERNIFQKQITELEADIIKLQTERDEHIQNKRKADQYKMEREHLKREISNIKEGIEKMRSELVPESVLKKRHETAAATLCEEILSTEFKIAEAFNEAIKAELDYRFGMAAQSRITHLLGLVKNNIMKIDKEHSEAERICNDNMALKEAEIEKRNIKSQEAESYKKKARPEIDWIPYESFLAELDTKSLEQLTLELSELNARFNSAQLVGDNVFAKQNALEAEIEKIHLGIIANKVEIDRLTREKLKYFEIFQIFLNKLISSLNQQFGKFMSSMNCIGEVQLKNKSEMDFKSYGIEILVQFRKDAPIQPLDRHIQSGGERAIAIAAYTLSLQQLTYVPFRCVDEINQGMDANNERRVYNMIVEEITKSGSQYFFVTPKLLPKLDSNSKVCVLVVYNAKHITAGNYFEQ